VNYEFRPASFLKDCAMQISRRQFVSATAVAAAGLARRSSSSVVADEKPTERKFKKAVKINMVKPGETLLEKFKLLKELGFDVIELDAVDRRNQKGDGAGRRFGDPNFDRKRVERFFDGPEGDGTVH